MPHHVRIFSALFPSYLFKIKLKNYQISLVDLIINFIISIHMNTESHTKPEKSTLDMQVKASFRKVVSFDLLFLGLGMPIGAGILAAILGI